MEEALRTLLLETAALEALVGSRVDWGIRSGAPLPAVRLFMVSGQPSMNLAGPSGWMRSRVQVEGWGRTFKAARDVGDVIAGKNGVGGALNGVRVTVGGIRLRTFIIGRRSGTDEDAEGVVHQSSSDVLVWHASA